MISTAVALVLFDTLASPTNVSRAGKFASGLLCTNSAPALALSLDVPLYRAVCNHLASEGFSELKYKCNHKLSRVSNKRRILMKLEEGCHIKFCVK